MVKRQRKSSGRMASKGFPIQSTFTSAPRVRLRRTLLGISQMKLAEAIGLTFQQVQKYESGANRVSSSRLYDLAGILDVPLAYFFDEMSAGVSAQTPSALMRTSTGPRMSKRRIRSLSARRWSLCALITKSRIRPCESGCLS